MWVLVTPLVSFFEVVFSRSQQTAKDLIGDSYSGIVTSDRYSGYNWIALEQRQVCWAHLKRDLTAMAERIGASHEIGTALLRRQHRLFRWWHRVRDGTLSREPFIAQVCHLRQGFKTTLAETAALPIDSDEKSPLSKTVRTCRRLLKVEPALWTFVAGTHQQCSRTRFATGCDLVQDPCWLPISKRQSVRGQIAHGYHLAQGSG